MNTISQRHSHLIGSIVRSHSSGHLYEVREITNSGREFRLVSTIPHSRSGDGYVFIDDLLSHNDIVVAEG